MRRILVASMLLISTLTKVDIARAQTDNDTLRLSVKQAEDLFLKNNLQLLAQHYNIDNANAQIITARLFPNPDFSFSNGIYANDASSGPAYKEQSFSLSQLFTTAGKRNKSIQLAKLGADQARYQFFDLMRTLKFTVRSDFYTVYYQRESAAVYSEEIMSLKKTLVAYKEQYKKGNIAEKELLRIQAQLYSLQVEYNSLLSGIDTTASQLKMLLRIPVQTAVQPVVAEGVAALGNLSSISYVQLLDSAAVNRYDLLYSKATVSYNNKNLELQKATAVPDISLSVNYDRLGGYGTNYLGAGIGFGLPFFNRNQGAIKQAKIAIDQSKVQLQNQQDQVESDVFTAYKTALRQEELYNSFDPQFKEDFTHLIKEVNINYQKRNISMLEFLDFYDSYKTNTLQLNNLILSKVTTLEQLNFVTGTAFFNK